jgi:hypothetical protein
MTIKELGGWLVSSATFQKVIDDPAQRLMQSMTITAKNRYNASIRLKRIGAFSFYTTVFLSLGLILIPLLESAGVRLCFSVKVLNMLQIFLAVAVLVYSVINGTAKYEVRSEKLNECGDRIKELMRELRVEISESKGGKAVDMRRYDQRYYDVSTDSENHTRSDHSLTVIRTPEYYTITGIPYLAESCKAYIPNLIPYIAPILLIIIEVIFITDMLGITDFLPHILIPIPDPS